MRILLLAISIFSINVLLSQSEKRQKIFYENNQYELSVEQQLSLKEMTDGVKDDEKITILGYASRLGDEAKNLELSKKRAEYIRNLLNENGQTKSAIDLRYFGEEFSTESKDQEREWRRVDVIISKKDRENENPFKPDDLPEEFTINPNIDTTIIGRKGTKIEIKAGTLINTETGELAEKVTIKLQEYISMMDIVEKGLTTKSDGSPLESGGMIKIEANENNQNVGIRKGKNIKISIPCTACKPGMTTFYGEKEGGEINWKKSQEKSGKIESRKTLPIFAEGQESLNHFIQQNRRYPDKAFSKKIEGTVQIKVLISEKGELVEPKIIKNVETSLDQEAMRIVEKMPRWTPAMLDGQPIEAIYTFPIQFKLMKDPFEGQNITSLGGGSDMDFAVDKAMDSARKEEERKERLAKLAEKQAVIEFGNYIITSSKLGWINIDKFDQSQMTTYIVDANTIDFVNVYVVMKNQKSLFRNEYRTNSKFNFRNISKDQDIYVMAIKSMEGKMYLALEESNTSNQSITLTKYREATISEIKTSLNMLQMK